MAPLPPITQNTFPETQYLRQAFPKKQIYVHHTASSANPFGVIEWWKSNAERVGTAFLVAREPNSKKLWKDGELFQLFGSQYGCWHLGLKDHHLAKGGPKAKDNGWLNMYSVGIEITNWGQLVLKDGKFHTYEAGVTVPENQVVEYTSKYRGYRYYQKYTDGQLENTRKLLRYLCDKWEIDPKFKGMRMFDICPEALQGQNGVWTHTSVRPDKFDCHPQKELVQMLQSL